VSRSAGRVFEVLRRLIVASTSELRSETGLTAPTVKRACQELVDAQLARLTPYRGTRKDVLVYQLVASSFSDDEEEGPPIGGPSSSGRNGERAAFSAVAAEAKAEREAFDAMWQRDYGTLAQRIGSVGYQDGLRFLQRLQLGASGGYDGPSLEQLGAGRCDDCSRRRGVDVLVQERERLGVLALCSRCVARRHNTGRRTDHDHRMPGEAYVFMPPPPVVEREEEERVAA
jgi:hypothetical protein